MKPARILILTGSHLCRNPRVVKEASTLGAAGYAVTVLGVRSHRPSVAPDADLVASTGLFFHRQVELLDGPAAWLRRARSRLARELVHRARVELPSSLGPAPALLRAARAHPADLVIAHTEPALWAAVRLLDAGRRVAADLEDWHSEDLPASDRASRPLRLLRSIERDLLHRAGYVVTTSRALADALHARYAGRRPGVLPNDFPLSRPSAGSPCPVPCAPPGPPAFFWFSQTVGPGRGLEPFLAAWSRTSRPSRLVLLGDTRPAERGRLLALLPNGFRPRVSFLPPVPPGELPALIARHDIGLALEQSSILNRDLTITNKVFQYLDAGLALFATPTAGQREALAAAPGAGLLDDLSCSAATAARLDALLGDPARLAAMRAAARAAAESGLCWEKHAPALLALVARALPA